MRLSLIDEMFDEFFAVITSDEHGAKAARLFYEKSLAKAKIEQFRPQELPVLDPSEFVLPEVIQVTPADEGAVS